MDIVNTPPLDILDTTGTPALSSTSDMPVVETKPDASPAPKEEAPASDVKAAPAADPAADKTPVESATTETPEEPSASDSPKKAQGVQKRLDELTKQREDANRRAERAAEALQTALKTLERLTGKPADEAARELNEADPEPLKPVKTGFDDLDGYEAALLDYSDQKAAWVARREVKAARAQDLQEQMNQRIREEQQTTFSSYRSRRDKVAEKYADFNQVAESPDVTVSPVIAQAILHDESGPELQYYFGKNPDEAKRISALNPYVQLVEVGKLAAKLTAKAEPAAPKVSAARPPITRLQPEGAATPKPLEELSMEEYAARRREAIAKDGRRPTRH